MTLQEFVNKWTGKFCEVAGSSNALFQCVDAANAYLREVLGSPIVEWTDAVYFPAKMVEDYDFIENTPTGVPQAGDLIVWKPSPGHIAIFLDGNDKEFNSFDQNYPLNSPCHIQKHTTYFNVVGWLRRKGGDNMAEIENLKLRITELESDGNRKTGLLEEREEELIHLKAANLDFQTTVETLQNSQISLQDDLQREKIEKVNLVTSLEAQVQRLEADSQTLAEEISIEKKENLRLSEKLDGLINSYSGITLISLGVHKIVNEIKLVFRRR